MLENIWQWLNERWPISPLIHWGLDEEIPGGTRFSYTFGSAILVVVLIQVVTGILLLFYYVPTVENAYSSVNFLITRVPFGWLVNGLHYWGGNAMIMLVLLHMSRVFIWKAYKNPRELTWLLGVGLFLTTMALTFTGPCLPWDQKGYWAAEVGTSIPGSLPLVGDLIKQLMRGTMKMGQLTLSRFFIVHAAILPSLLVGFIAAHQIAFRRYGSLGPWDERKMHFKGRFWPEQVFKDALVAILAVMVLIVLAVYLPKPFYGMADPLDSSYVPKPAWNFLFLYQVIKFFPGLLEPIGSAGVPALLTLFLIALPFFDRGPERNPFKRPVALGTAIVLAVLIITLTLMGASSKPVSVSVANGSTDPVSKTSLPVVQGQGAEIFQSAGCISCHRVNNAGGTAGPDLSGEGSKGRSRQWLITQIRTPQEHNPNSFMPGFPQMTEEQLNSLADYLLGLKNGISQSSGTSKIPVVKPDASAPPSSTTVAKNNSLISDTLSASQNIPGPAADIIGNAGRGSDVFRQQCTGCHGEKGAGGVPNPESNDGVVPALVPIDRNLFNQDPMLFAESIDPYIQHGSVPAGVNPQLRMPMFGDNNMLTQGQIANVEAYILKLNGINRGKLVNPGMQPRSFFALSLAIYVLLMLVIGIVYWSLPK
jgi:ubiquinol-cytochrome c reductase cytochrome b subunit